MNTGTRYGMWSGEAAMAGHIVVDVGSLNSEPLRSAGTVHFPNPPNPGLLPPQELGSPKGTHGARRQLVRSRCSS